MPSLVERLRAAGLPMGSRYANGYLVGWTTDDAKAEAAREAGARVVPCPSRDPRFSGHEIIAHKDAP